LDGGLKGRLLGFGHLSHEVENPGGAGIQPAAGFSPPSRGSRLKAGCSLKGRLQARLPATQGGRHMPHLDKLKRTT